MAGNKPPHSLSSFKWSSISTHFIYLDLPKVKGYCKRNEGREPWGQPDLLPSPVTPNWTWGVRSGYRDDCETMGPRYSKGPGGRAEASVRKPGRPSPAVHWPRIASLLGLRAGAAWLQRLLLLSLRWGRAGGGQTRHLSSGTQQRVHTREDPKRRRFALTFAVTLKRTGSPASQNGSEPKTRVRERSGSRALTQGHDFFCAGAKVKRSPSVAFEII